MTKPRKRKTATKAERRLAARIKSFESVSDKKGYTKPGSLNK